MYAELLWWTSSYFMWFSFVSLITALCLFKGDIIDLSYLCFTRTLHTHTHRSFPFPLSLMPAFSILVVLFFFLFFPSKVNYSAPHQESWNVSSKKIKVCIFWLFSVAPSVMLGPVWYHSQSHHTDGVHLFIVENLVKVFLKIYLMVPFVYLKFLV